MARPPSDPSGIMVYPKLPIPQQRTSEPSVRGSKGGGGGNNKRNKWIAGLAAAIVIGGAAGYLAAPSKAKELAKTKTALVQAQKAATAEKTRADGLDQQLATAVKDKQDAEQKVQELSSKAADVEKQSAQLAEEEKKVQDAIDKASGSVSTEGDEIHLKLVDRVLFPVGDDQLTPRGKAVLAKLAVALEDLPDKQIWVQGHTDDQPIYVHPQKPDPKAKKGKAHGKDKVDPQPIRFITNWELSAARALQVVHYLQDEAKINPHRLAAVAFGQYRPISRRNKALNRRIEIVLLPEREHVERAHLQTAASASHDAATKKATPRHVARHATKKK